MRIRPPTRVARLATRRSRRAQRADAAWLKAEDKATKKNVDCAVTTVDGSTAGTDLEAALSAIQGAITAGLDTTGSSDDASCASTIIGAAGKLCSGISRPSRSTSSRWQRTHR